MLHVEVVHLIEVRTMLFQTAYLQVSDSQECLAYIIPHIVHTNHM